jgi:DNA-directed RNA polymerase beta subunit
MLTSVGECPYDEGGYFVADGKEKIVVSNELVITNRAIVRHIGRFQVLVQGSNSYDQRRRRISTFVSPHGPRFDR